MKNLVPILFVFAFIYSCSDNPVVEGEKRKLPTPDYLLKTIKMNSGALVYEFFYEDKVLTKLVLKESGVANTLFEQTTNAEDVTYCNVLIKSRDNDIPEQVECSVEYGEAYIKYSPTNKSYPEMIRGFGLHGTTYLNREIEYNAEEFRYDYIQYVTSDTINYINGRVLYSKYDNEELQYVTATDTLLLGEVHHTLHPENPFYYLFLPNTENLRLLDYGILSSPLLPKRIREVGRGKTIQDNFFSYEFDELDRVVAMYRTESDGFDTGMNGLIQLDFSTEEPIRFSYYE